MARKPRLRNDSPKPLSETVSRQMRATRETGTGPELALRKLLHAAGLRYRVNFQTGVIPRRTIDIAFPKAKIAVFVDGCFWHGCRAHKTIPKNNRAWWDEKIRANRSRDIDTDAKLSANGWQVLRFWEHDSPEYAAQSVVAILRRLQNELGGG